MLFGPSIHDYVYGHADPIFTDLSRTNQTTTSPKQIASSIRDARERYLPDITLGPGDSIGQKAISLCPEGVFLDLTKIPDNPLDTPPPIEDIPADAAVIGSGFVALHKSGIYWPAMPGKKGFRVLNFTRPEAAPYVALLLMDLNLLAPIRFTAVSSRAFILNRVFSAATNEAYFNEERSDRHLEGARYYTKRAVNSLALWPIAYYNNIFQGSQRPDYADLDKDDIAWIEAIVMSTRAPHTGPTIDSSSVIDLASPLLSPTSHYTISGKPYPTQKIELSMLDYAYTSNLDKLVQLDDLEAMTTITLPKAADGSVDEAALNGYEEHLYRAFAPKGTVKREPSIKPILVPTTELFAAVDDFLRIWEKRILPREKGVTTLTETVPMTTIAVGTVHKMFLQKFDRIQGTKKYYKNLYETLVHTVARYAETRGIHAANSKKRRLTHISGASKSEIAKYRQEASTGAVASMARQFSPEDIKNSLQSDYISQTAIGGGKPPTITNPKKVKVVLPKVMKDFWTQRMNTLQKKCNRDKSLYEDYMWFFNLCLLYFFTQYFVSANLSAGDEKDLESGQLPSRYMLRLSKLIARYLQDDMDDPNYTKTKPWKIEDSERALMLKAIRAIDAGLDGLDWK